MRSRSSFAWALLLVGALAVSACGKPSATQPQTPPETQGSAAAAAKPEMKKIRVGCSTASMGFLSAYVAEGKGFWKEQGLEVDYAILNGGAPTTQALVGNALDIGCTDYSPPADALQAGQEIRVFWSELNYPTFQWFAKKGETLASLKKKEKVIAGTAALGGATHLWTKYVLEKLGFDVQKQVVFQAIGGPPARLAALQRGQVDLIPVGEWPAMLLLDEGHVRFSTMSDFAPDISVNVFIAHKEFLDKNPETVKAFLRGIIAAIRWTKQNPEAAADLMIQKLEIKPENKKYVVASVKEMAVGMPEDGVWSIPGFEISEQLRTEEKKQKPIDIKMLLEPKFIEWFKANPVK